jgi:hypothetical protein
MRCSRWTRASSRAFSGSKQIELRFRAAQQQALQAQPQLATQMQNFQTSLEAKMAQMDPGAEQLIARFQELQTRLAGAMQGAQQP